MPTMLQTLCSNAMRKEETKIECSYDAAKVLKEGREESIKCETKPCKSLKVFASLPSAQFSMDGRNGHIPTQDF